MKPTKTLAERSKEADSDANVAASIEFALRAPLHESAETDFVHSIVGRINAESEGCGRGLGFGRLATADSICRTHRKNSCDLSLGIP